MVLKNPEPPLEETKSFVEVMECSRKNLGWFRVSELEGGFEE